MKRLIALAVAALAAAAPNTSAQDFPPALVVTEPVITREFHDQLTLIDVRTPGEFSWFHIDGAENMPGLLSNAQGFKGKRVDEPVIVICMTGHRSPMVAYQLKKRGYKQVYNLTWGMLAWKLFGGKTQ